MSDEKTYVLKYRIKGEKKNIEIKIDFVSIFVLEEYGRIKYETQMALYHWYQSKENDKLIYDLKKEKPDGYKESILKLETENVEHSNYIKPFEHNTFFQRRYELLKELLESNSIKNELLLSDEFWKKNVDASEINNLFSALIDNENSNDSKKKVM